MQKEVDKKFRSPLVEDKKTKKKIHVEKPAFLH